ncbi:MAG: helix-turn-helix domain-containing protein [Cytophagaceae bacterium]|jgi:hypothetical protein|nr:helix-turn-helix domain-containing protein [Cytophagaceae bacterium]
MLITSTNQIELARMFIENTGRNLFLTGKAGTGKTTFLKYLKQNAPKRMVVVAPTGVAAINAGGVTIHSFFQLPFGPQIPNHYLLEHDRQPENNYRFNREKLNIIRSINLLVIDEISMVRADLLDAIDGVLRKYRQRSKPFGGVQVLMIGDLQQLAPVVKDSEQTILRKYYKGPFFFQSKVMEHHPVETIELTHIFRQRDGLFINVLNEIRESRLSAKGMELLQKRYIPDFKPVEGYITLTSHNHLAQTINSRQLDVLPNSPVIFRAVIEGEFPSYSYPNDENLVLKKGAQVMFVKNDPSREKLFFNGKIGTVIDIGKETVTVKCDDADNPITVMPAEWQNYKFSLNTTTNEIEETVIGKFTQIPLKAAWAITIHKSQGLTFDKVIIDSNAAFAHGQVYVALSRCRTLEGIVLSSPVNPASIISSEPVTEFIKESENNTPNHQKILLYRKEYEQELIQELFDFTGIHKNMLWLEKYIDENPNTIFGELAESAEKIIAAFRTDVIDVSGKFQRQLQQLFQHEVSPENNKLLQERVKKGSTYFLESLKKLLTPICVNPNYTTDNKAVKKEIGKQLERIRQKYIIHTECLAACSSNGFTITGYLSAKSVSNIEKALSPVKKQSSDDYTLSSVVNTELYRRLRIWRTNKAAKLNMPEYMVLPTKSIIVMSDDMPSSLKELLRIKGFGKTKVEMFGKELLLLINAYKMDSNKGDGVVLDFSLDSEKSQKEKAPTLDVTLGLYRMGFSVDEIAKKRELAVSTIYSHLVKGIAKGEVDIQKLMSSNKISIITDYCTAHQPQTSTEVKNALGDDYSYDEIRMVMANIKLRTESC